MNSSKRTGLSYFRHKFKYLWKQTIKWDLKINLDDIPAYILMERDISVIAGRVSLTKHRFFLSIHFFQGMSTIFIMEP